MRQYKHLLGIYRIGEIDKLRKHAMEQYVELPPQSRVSEETQKKHPGNWQKIVPRVEIHLILVDTEKEA
jgi:hypothetical protein